MSIETAHCQECNAEFTYKWNGHRRRIHCDECRTPKARMARRRAAKKQKDHWTTSTAHAERRVKDKFVMPEPGPVVVFNWMTKMVTS